MYGGEKIDWASLILGRKFTGCFCFTLHLRTISKYKPPPPPPFGGRLYLDGRFKGRLFALRVLGAYVWTGLYVEGLFLGILGYVINKLLRDILLHTLRIHRR